MFLDMLKSIFIPSEDFFTNWLDDLNEYFGDAFGILYYPFELLISFLNRVSQLNDTTTAIISVPAFTLNFMGHSATIFEAYSYDFNDLLVNDTFRNIHNIYLLMVDVILWLGVAYLASKCINHTIGGMGGAVSDDINSSDSVLDDQAYENYSRTQRAKTKYDNEQYESNKNKKKRKIGF